MWSYKSALSLLAQNDGVGAKNVVERTNVASIITAARSNLRRGINDQEDDKIGEKEGGSVVDMRSESLSTSARGDSDNV